MVDNCDKFYLVEQGDTCENIASKNNIPLQEFLRWNPQAGQKCSGLWASAYACVSVVGFKPTPTAPDSGVQTPSPAQPGMVDHCSKFYFVNPGDSCITIAAKAGISVEDFSRWNANVGSQCTGLWASTYACVGVVSAFRLKTRYHADCTGNVNNDVSVSDSVCVNTGCSVASLEIAADGYCPNGQVQISYWEQPGCVGKWFGYGYADKGQCRRVWTEGWKFKSLHLRCARAEDDCVSNRTCTIDPEPAGNLC